MADIAINPVVRRVQFTGNTGLGPFAFTFNILQNTDIIVYKNTTLLTLTTDYTVTINANGTGSVTLTGSGSGTALITTDNLTIIGGRELSRTTDFVTAGDLLASSLNEQLDSNVIMSQQLDERFSRTISVSPGDADKTLTLPTVDDRKDKILKFDTEGNVEAAAASTVFANTVVGANFVNDVFTGTGAQTVFTLSTAPGSKNNCQIYIDGVYQEKSTFSINASTLTFTEAPPLNASIEVIIGNALDSFASDANAVNYDQGGTGYVSRTVESKLQDIVSVKDFGAVGDGVTDDTAAIQAAIDSVARPDVFFPAGTYKVTGITIDKNWVTLRGGSENASRLYCNTSNADIITIDNVEHTVIENLDFITSSYAARYAVNGTNVPTTRLTNLTIRELQYGIRMTGTWNSMLQNIRAFTIQEVGIFLSQANDSAVIACTTTGINTANAAHRGLQLNDCLAINITGGAIEDYYHAIYLSGSVVDYSGYVESNKGEDFYLSSANDKLNILNAYAQAEAAQNKAVIKAVGGITKVHQIKCVTAGGYGKLFELTGAAIGLYGDVSFADSTQIVGTCVTGSGGLIAPMFPMNKERILTQVIDFGSMTSFSNEYIYITKISRPFRLGRVWARLIDGTEADNAIKLGTDDDDDIFIAKTNLDGASSQFFDPTQASSPYTNQTGWLKLTYYNDGSTTTAKYQFFFEVIQGDALNTVPNPTQATVADFENINVPSGSIV